MRVIPMQEVMDHRSGYYSEILADLRRPDDKTVVTYGTAVFVFYARTQHVVDAVRAVLAIIYPGRELWTATDKGQELCAGFTWPFAEALQDTLTNTLLRTIVEAENEA